MSGSMRARQIYSEDFRSTGIPLEELPGLIERAQAAGATRQARLHLEEVPRGPDLPVGGTRASIVWNAVPEGGQAMPGADA